MHKVFNILAICTALIMALTSVSFAEEIQFNEDDVTIIESSEEILSDVEAEQYEPVAVEEEMTLGDIENLEEPEKPTDPEEPIITALGHLVGSGSNGDFYNSGTFTITATGAWHNGDKIRIKSWTTDGASMILIRVYLGSSTYGTDVGHAQVSVTSSGVDIPITNHSNGNTNATDTCTYTVWYNVVEYGSTAIVNAQFVH